MAIGIGTILKVGDGASPEVFTDVAKVMDIDWPKLKAYLVETTNHSDEYVQQSHSGVREFTSFKVTLEWGDATTTHATIRTNFDSNTAKNYKLVSPDAAKTYTFAAFVEELGRATKIKDVQRMEVMIRPQGAATES